MADYNLAGQRFLVIEDEYYLADEARDALLEAGAEVLGPVATLDEAHDVLTSDATVDSVLLDINLRGSIAFEFADALQARRVPFMFITGYDCSMLPERFANVPRLQKPASSKAMIEIAASLASSDRYEGMR